MLPSSRDRRKSGTWGKCAGGSRGPRLSNWSWMAQGKRVCEQLMTRGGSSDGLCARLSETLSAKRKLAESAEALVAVPVLGKRAGGRWCTSDLPISFYASDRSENGNAPISAMRFSFRSCHRAVKSSPTTLCTSSAVTASPVPPSLTASRVARALTQLTLGHATFSSVPSWIASDQHELRQGLQLVHQLYNPPESA